MTGADPLGIARTIEAREARVAARLVAAHRRLFTDSEATRIDVNGACAAFTRPQWPMSRVYGLGMEGPVDPDAFERLRSFYRERDCPVRIELCPFADRSVLVAISGRPAQFGGWKIVLAQELARGVGAPVSAGVGVEIADDAEVWAGTVAQGFDRSANDPTGLDVPRTLYAAEGATCFLARIDGEPAGGGLVGVDGAWAGLGSASTIPGFRGRGVQAALIAARLAFAREAGCTHAVVTAVPGTGSHRNLLRAGFAPLYARCFVEVT